MRIVAVSDTHQNTARLRQSVAQAIADGRIDVFIHCGDGVRDLNDVENLLIASNPNLRIYAVRGNCDAGAIHYPDAETADLNGVRTLITHGNIYQVKHGLGKLAKAARELHMELVFFGHSHLETAVVNHGVTLLNPGSLSAWSTADTAYLQVVIDDKRNIHVNFIKQSLK